MMDADLKRLIQQMIKKELNVILTAQVVSNDHKTETISDHYPGADPIPKVSVMAPYGMVSRAPKGTKSVVARHGNDPANRLVIGHRDETRPKDLDEGEWMAYSIGEMKIKVGKDKIQVGQGDTYEVLPVGEKLAELLGKIIDLLQQHTHIGNLGYPTSAANEAAQIALLKAQYITNEKILAKKGGRF